MYRQFTKASEETISEGSKRPDQKLSCYRCGPSMTDSNVLPKKPSVELVEKEAEAVCRTKNIGKVHHEEYDSAEDSDEVKIVTKKCS